ncbi:DedA family protein [Staphylospora marina]|uniref:DedA family protein n=1 Tax=Staphylospora marina TaxID=2490858 RepID=UPI0013DDA2CF|nr:DedA family protein [Staphylospora marina]
MLQTALDFLKQCGVWGLFAATAIEASSLPFPGATFVLLYGYLIDVGFWGMVLIGAVNSLVYTLFSLIPYYLGSGLGKWSRKKVDPQKIEKAQAWFRKYGDWSITLSRPTGFGNYISYISGMSGIKPWRFLLFSYIGVFPWNVFLLMVGHSGNLETIHQFLDGLERIGLVLVAVGVLAIGTWMILRRRTRRAEVHCEEG